MTISEKLSQIRERDADAHGIGRDHHIVKSQADVTPLLEAVEAVRSHLIAARLDHPQEYGDYGYGVNDTVSNALSILNEKLGGGDDER